MNVTIVVDGVRYEPEPAPMPPMPGAPDGLRSFYIDLERGVSVILYLGEYVFGGARFETAVIANSTTTGNPALIDEIEIEVEKGMVPAYARAGLELYDSSNERDGYIISPVSDKKIHLPPGFVRTIRFASSSGDDLLEEIRDAEIQNPSGEPFWSDLHGTNLRGDDAEGGRIQEKYRRAIAAVATNAIDHKAGLYTRDLGGLRPYGHPFGGKHGGDGIYPTHYAGCSSPESFVLAMIQFDLSLERMGLWLTNSNGTIAYGSVNRGGGRHWPSASWPEHRRTFGESSSSAELLAFGFYDAQHDIRWRRGHKHVESTGDPIAKLATRVYATAGFGFFSGIFGARVRPGTLNRERSWTAHAVAGELHRMADADIEDHPSIERAVSVASHMVSGALSNGIGKAVWGPTSNVPQRGHPSPMPWRDRMTGFNGTVYGNDVTLPIEEGQTVSFEEGISLTARMHMATALLRLSRRDARELGKALISDCLRSAGYLSLLSVTSPHFELNGKAGSPQYLSCVLTTPRFVPFRSPNSWAGGAEVVTCLSGLALVGLEVGSRPAANIAAMLILRLGLHDDGKIEFEGLQEKLDKRVYEDSRDGNSASANVSAAAYVFLSKWILGSVRVDQSECLDAFNAMFSTLINFSELKLSAPEDSTRPPLVVDVSPEAPTSIEMPGDLEAPLVVRPAPADDRNTHGQIPDEGDATPDEPPPPPHDTPDDCDEASRSALSLQLRGLAAHLVAGGDRGPVAQFFRAAGFKVSRGEGDQIEIRLPPETRR